MEDLIEDEITAQWAKERVDVLFNIQVENGIKNCLDRIKTAVDGINNIATIYECDTPLFKRPDIRAEIFKDLKLRGFIVEFDEIPENMGSKTKIINITW